MASITDRARLAGINPEQYGSLRRLTRDIEAAEALRKSSATKPVLPAPPPEQQIPKAPTAIAPREFADPLSPADVMRDAVSNDPSLLLPGQQPTEAETFQQKRARLEESIRKDRERLAGENTVRTDAASSTPAPVTAPAQTPVPVKTQPTVTVPDPTSASPPIAAPPENPEITRLQSEIDKLTEQASKPNPEVENLRREIDRLTGTIEGFQGNVNSPAQVDQVGVDELKTLLLDRLNETGPDSITSRNLADFDVSAEKGRKQQIENLSRLGLLREGGDTIDVLGEFDSGVQRGRQDVLAQGQERSERAFTDALDLLLGDRSLDLREKDIDVRDKFNRDVFDRNNLESSLGGAFDLLKTIIPGLNPNKELLELLKGRLGAGVGGFGAVGTAPGAIGTLAPAEGLAGGALDLGASSQFITTGSGLVGSGAAGANTGAASMMGFPSAPGALTSVAITAAPLAMFALSNLNNVLFNADRHTKLTSAEDMIKARDRVIQDAIAMGRAQGLSEAEVRAQFENPEAMKLFNDTMDEALQKVSQLQQSGGQFGGIDTSNMTPEQLALLRASGVGV